MDADAPSSVLRSLQQDEWVASLKTKTLHSTFLGEVHKPGRKVSECVHWLSHSNLSSRTEAAIVAMQDGVVLTNSYMRHVFKRTISGMCRNGCRVQETVSHILACCPFNFSLYKERHDAVLLLLLAQVASTYGITLHHSSLQQGEDARPAVFHSGDGRVAITLDLTVRTDVPMSSCRPDLIVIDRPV